MRCWRQARRPRGLRQPINLFFHSLAEDRREHSVAVVLSGKVPTIHRDCKPSRRWADWCWRKSRPRPSSTACRAAAWWTSSHRRTNCPSRSSPTWAVHRPPKTNNSPASMTVERAAPPCRRSAPCCGHRPATTFPSTRKAPSTGASSCAKHAMAKHIEVSLRVSGGRAVMSISDDGIGFDPDTPTSPGRMSGQGLAVMRERAAFAGGRLQVESSPCQGTCITLDIGYKGARRLPAGLFLFRSGRRRK